MGEEHQVGRSGLLGFAAAAVAVAVLITVLILDRRTDPAALALSAVAALLLLLAGLALRAERRAQVATAAARAALAAELEAAHAEADEANRAKSRFLATVSHDMRQPLHALALYVAALERRVAHRDARKIIANMDGAVRSMSRMFAALLDLARLEAGALSPERETFRAGDLIDDVINYSADPRAIAARVRTIDCALLVESDFNLLEIALRNLVSNAVKYSEGRKVLVGCRRERDHLRFEVHDQGPGIAPHKLDRLFIEFARGEGARPDGGIGLGLAIVDGMTRLLGHELGVRSEVGRGTIFSIRVPRVEGVAADRAAEAEAVRLDGVRVLVADNEDYARDAMRHAFEDAGALVEGASSAEAVRRIGFAAADLMVLDMNLGADDGLALATEIEAARGAAVPTLIVTGATTGEALTALQASGRMWLTKPASAAELTRAAARALGGR